MLAGLMKTKAALYKRTGTANNIEYIFYKNIKGLLVHKSGSQVIQSLQAIDSVTVSLRIRFRRDLESSMQILISNKMYDIVHIQEVGATRDLLLDLKLTI